MALLFPLILRRRNLGTTSNKSKKMSSPPCCADTLDAGFDLTYDQEQCIKGVQEQILSGMPNILDHINEQEQHSTDSQSQELTM